MNNERQLFLKHLAPTSLNPIALKITHASGAMLYNDSQQFIDLIGGISVCNTGHCHPLVLKAINEQSKKYLHIMVYGELIQSPQVNYAQLLTSHLPSKLDSVYFTNSGAEAVEGAMKLAKKITGRAEIIACEKSYHGSTQGALSLFGDEQWRNAYRPLLPGIKHINHGSMSDLDKITEKTACIIIEPIQAEAGILEPSSEWIQALRKRCTQTGTLLIFDEIQTGFGRTGKLWAFQHFEIVPDILLLGKALGGGLPLGAFVASYQHMQHLASNPALGHMTTFGGHPLSCAAGKAALEIIIEDSLILTVESKEQLFLQKLKHPKIKTIRSKGLMMAVELENFETVQTCIQRCIEHKPIGVFTDWFLFASNSIRIAPPLNISEVEIEQACNILLESLSF